MSLGANVHGEPLLQPMVSLPPATQSNIADLGPNALCAFNGILDFERNVKTSKDALHARMIGYLILHAPSSDARHEVIRVIDLCNQTHDTLSGLGQYLLDHFIRPCELSIRITWRNELNRNFQSSNSKNTRQSFQKIPVLLHAMMRRWVF